VITVSCTIMHASFDSKRKKTVQELLYQLHCSNSNTEFLSVDLISDQFKMGAWWTAKKCWEKGAISKATHHLVLQDDIKLCYNFCAGLKKVISAYPNDIISLFYGPRKNFNGTSRWGIAESAWGQAIVMPVEFVKEFLSWDKENICPSLKHDDSRLALFTSKTGKTAKVPFPNLVNHRDGEIRSVMGNHGGKKRNTEYFMGSNDPVTYDWNDKSNQMKSIRSLSEYKRYLLK
jgi:hypothetical protein